ncbi:MAG: DNA-binding MarR family transcriptional regulator [Gammaproteobacteria bacterium]|jgi:DNA-binding MarR family transcriptional regulator
MDRRQRRLYLSTSGEALWMALRKPQIERFARVFRAVGRQASDGFEAVLTELQNVQEREQILDRVKR